jgi:hypothetical protein
MAMIVLAAGIVGFSGTARAARVVEVMDKDKKAVLDAGSLSGIAVKALIVLAPADSKGPFTAQTAPALGSVESVEPERCFVTVQRVAPGKKVEVGWSAEILAQNLVPRRPRVLVVVDDSALWLDTSYVQTRGCAGIRPSIRLEKAMAESSKQKDYDLRIQTQSPTPKEAGELPSSYPSSASSPLADILVKVICTGGREPDEVVSDILVIGPDRKVLERAQGVSVQEVPERVNALAAEYAAKESERQSVLSLHNPNPGFEIKLWLNAPSGFAAASSNVNTRSIELAAPGGTPIGVETNQTALLRRGDKHIYGFRSTRDCYLVLYNVGPDGLITVLLPSKYIPNNYFKAGIDHTIPDLSCRDANGEPCKFIVVKDKSKPVGLEMIKALATLHPMPLTEVDLAAFEKKDFLTGRLNSSDTQWSEAANSLTRYMALTRSIGFSAGSPSASDFPPAEKQAVEEMQNYLRDLSQWSDAMITFYTAD